MKIEVMVMSKYTTEVRYICETFAGLNESVGYNDVEDVLNKSWEKVFNFDFPIFNEDYKSVLCKKILRHYYTQEIGVETVGLWQLKLNTKMNEIMPYYNKLYVAWNDEFNPLDDTRLERTHTLKKEENEDNKINGNTAINNTSKDKYSDTPQGGLQGVENDEYLTNARIITDGGETDFEQNGNRKLNSTDEFIEKLYGKSGGKSFSEMLVEFKNALINIDMQIIDELQPLFMQIW